MRALVCFIGVGLFHEDSVVGAVPDSGLCLVCLVEVEAVVWFVRGEYFVEWVLEDSLFIAELVVLVAEGVD